MHSLANSHIACGILCVCVSSLHGNLCTRQQPNIDGVSLSRSLSSSSSLSPSYYILFCSRSIMCSHVLRMQYLVVATSQKCRRHDKTRENIFKTYKYECKLMFRLIVDLLVLHIAWARGANKPVIQKKVKKKKLENFRRCILYLNEKMVRKFSRPVQ